jgi:hypothetical protein
MQRQKIRPGLLLPLEHHCSRNILVWQALKIPISPSKFDVRDCFDIK